MRKTDKKTGNTLRALLTEVCEIALVRNDGFQWLTHRVNYDHFPDSLSVICVYDTNDQLAQADVETLRSLVQQKLASMGIRIKDTHRHIRFDTEENCSLQHRGRWQERLG